MVERSFSIHKALCSISMTAKGGEIVPRDFGLLPIVYVEITGAGSRPLGVVIYNQGRGE